MLSIILLSLKIASVATLFSFLLGTSLAYFLQTKKIPGKDIWESLIILPMVLPPSVTGYLLLILFGKRGILGKFLLQTFGIQIVFTWVGAAIAACIVSLPLMYQNAKAAFLSVDPTYKHVAQTMGTSRTRIFFTITFKLALPGIISGIVLSFARAIGEFGATVMIAGNIPGLTQTIPSAIYFAVESGQTQTANILVGIMTVFSFVLVITLNTWLKKQRLN
jgi:molybdate transport system permease protein